MWWQVDRKCKSLQQTKTKRDNEIFIIMYELTPKYQTVHFCYYSLSHDNVIYLRTSGATMWTSRTKSTSLFSTASLLELNSRLNNRQQTRNRAINKHVVSLLEIACTYVICATSLFVCCCNLALLSPAPPRTWKAQKRSSVQHVLTCGVAGKSQWKWCVNLPLRVQPDRPLLARPCIGRFQPPPPP